MVLPITGELDLHTFQPSDLGELIPSYLQACAAHGIREVRIVLEELGIHDLVGVSTADREGVADHRPLRLAEEAEDLAEVVDQAGEDEPARVAVAADCLGGLEQVLDLR